MLIEFLETLPLLSKLYLLSALLAVIVFFALTLWIVIINGLDHGQLESEISEVETIPEVVKGQSPAFRRLVYILSFFLIFGVVGLAFQVISGMGNIWSLAGALTSGGLVVWLVRVMD